jgi:beta propeller repeat protein
MLRSIGDGPISDNNIYVYDISTRKKTQITTSGYNGGPAIYGNKIVWTHHGSNDLDSNIHMYDLSTKKETQITTNTSDSYGPDIYGNNIVWQDNRNGNWDIYAFNLITHQQIHTLDSSTHEQPSIYGNKIVWKDDRNGKSDIYMGTLKYK